MSVDSTALVSLDLVKSYVGDEGVDVDVDSLLCDLINGVSESIRTNCDRLFHQADCIEYHDGDLSDCIIPNQYPVNSVASIYDDTERVFGADTLIDSTTYVIVDKIIIRLFETGGYFNQGIQNVKLTYNFGFAVIPLDLQQACVEIVSLKLKEGRGGGDLNVASKTRGELTTTYKDSEIPKWARDVLDKYKRFS